MFEEQMFAAQRGAQVGAIIKANSVKRASATALVRPTRTGIAWFILVRSMRGILTFAKKPMTYAFWNF
jgi:hypothetical protein